MCYFVSQSSVGKKILKSCPVGGNCSVVGTITNDQDAGDWSPIITAVTSVRPVIAGDIAASAWKDCKSNVASRRVNGCTAIIDAKGFGSLSKLADALDGRCWALHEVAKYDLAIADCKASLLLQPKNSYAHNNLGAALLGIGDYQNALVAFNSSISIKPDFYWSRVNRAKALIAIGKKEIAIADYEYLLSRDPTNQEIRVWLDKLKGDISANVNAPQPKAEVPESIHSPSPSVTGARTNAVKMERQGGVFVVPVRFNDTITLSAIVDSGASDVSVPADIVLTLMRTKTISQEDFLGKQVYVLADGSRVPSQQFRIRSLKVGEITVENIVASIASVNAEILLGQSFLSRFSSWSIDNRDHTLVLK